MHFLKHSLIFTITLLALSACTVFKKTIPKPVIISVNENSFAATLNSVALNAKYINNIATADIVEAFTKGFKSEASLTKNVTLQSGEENSDFILSLSSLEIKESSKTEKINDSKSQYNGMEVLLNTVECSATFQIVNTKNKSKSLMSCSNSKSRAEKVSNNRDIGDLITGTNKDHTQYHTKLLSDNICKTLAEDVGRRIWVPITRRIVKNL